VKKQQHDRVPPRRSSRAEWRAHIDQLLDDALANTFPASDPVSNLVPETYVEEDDEEEWTPADDIDGFHDRR